MIDRGAGGRGVLDGGGEPGGVLGQDGGVERDGVRVNLLGVTPSMRSTPRLT